MKKSLKNENTLGEKINPSPNTNQAITDNFQLINYRCTLKQTVEKDTTSVAPLMDLIIARRQLAETNQALGTKTHEHKRTSRETAATWHDLRQREINLRESLIRFNTFVKENHAKRERAFAKIEKEKATQENLNKEIQNLKDQLADLCEVEKNLKEKVNEYQVYKDFLAKAAAEGKNFNEIFDIIHRYEVLAMTSHELGEDQAAALVAVQGAREQLGHAADVQAQLMMNLQTDLAALRVRLNAASTLSAKWEGIVARVRAFAAEKSVEIQQVQHACWDLYKSVCHIRKEPLFCSEHDTEHQLTFITRRVQELGKVVRLAKKRNERYNVGVGTNPQTNTTNV